MTELTQSQQTALEKMITKRMENKNETREEAKRHIKDIFLKLYVMTKEM